MLNGLSFGCGFLVASRCLGRLAVFISLFLPLLAFTLGGTFSSSPLPVGR